MGNAKDSDLRKRRKEESRCHPIKGASSSARARASFTFNIKCLGRNSRSKIMAPLLSVFTSLTLACCLAYALPSVPSTHVEHEKRHIEHSPFVKRDAVESAFILPVRIGLTQSNLDAGHDRLMDISDPFSPNFAKHLTAEEVKKLFAPAKETVDAVRAWLEKEAGIASHRISVSPNKQWLQFDAPASEAGELFSTKFHYYEYNEHGDVGIACDSYHLPHHIREHVDYITPGVKMIKLAPVNAIRARALQKRDKTPGRKPTPFSPFVKPLDISKDQAESGSYCDAAVSPSCIKKAYGVDDTITKQEGNSIGIFESILELYQQGSLNDFFKTFMPNTPVGTHPTFKPVDGAPKPSAKIDEDDTEANLDFQMAFPLVYPDEIVNFQADDFYWENYKLDHPSKGLFNTWLDSIDGSYCNFTDFGITGDTPGIDATYPDTHKKGYNHTQMCGFYKPTNVVSVSYIEGETYLPMNYQRRQCAEFMKLGLQGVSVVWASGDYGVEQHYPSLCPEKGKIFGPNQPVNCPYVTSVGSTALAPGVAPEEHIQRATNEFGSGGGFSNIYPRPSYQDKAVGDYFKNHAPKYPFYRTKYNDNPNAMGGKYNRDGRGYPDVAALGQNILIYSDDSELVAGTSASTPIFASLIARINNARMAAGKKSIGFLNPTLYANPDAFYDVVVGNNPGCGTPGFNCTPGWDPVTGLGIPNYPALKKLFLSLP